MPLGSFREGVGFNRSASQKTLPYQHKLFRCEDQTMQLKILYHVCREVFFTFVAFLSLLTAVSSCSGNPKSENQSIGEKIPLKYAELLELTEQNGYFTAIFKDPWNKDEELTRLILVPDSIEMPEKMPPGTIVRIPLKRIVSGTAVHAGMLEELGCANSLVGVCEPNYINLPFVNQGINNGSIKDCGSGMTPDVESLINLKPDAIFLSPFENSGGFGKIEKLGVAVIPVSDYMEQGPLGRAEWIRFYGLLTGRNETADRIFYSVESNYNALKERVRGLKKGKKFLMNKFNNSSWYVPGGKSPIGQILADANVEYPWSENESTGSIPLSFESIVTKAGDSDVWLFHYYDSTPLTKDRLLSENKRYNVLRPFKNGEIYVDNLMIDGFSEQTPFHPDKILRDIILIAHPGVLDGEPQYFKKLNK